MEIVLVPFFLIAVLFAIFVHSNLILGMIASIALFYVVYSSVSKNSMIIPPDRVDYGRVAGVLTNLCFWIIFALLRVGLFHNLAHQYINFLFPRH